MGFKMNLDSGADFIPALEYLVNELSNGTLTVQTCSKTELEDYTEKLFGAIGDYFNANKKESDEPFPTTNVCVVELFDKMVKEIIVYRQDEIGVLENFINDLTKSDIDSVYQTNVHLLGISKDLINGESGNASKEQFVSWCFGRESVSLPEPFFESAWNMFIKAYKERVVYPENIPYSEEENYLALAIEFVKIRDYFICDIFEHLLKKTIK